MKFTGKQPKAQRIEGAYKAMSNHHVTLLMLFATCCSSSVVAQDAARTSDSTSTRSKQGSAAEQQWKPYRNIPDRCADIEATIVASSNAKTAQAIKHNEDIDRIRQSGGNPEKLVQEFLSRQASWDRLISDQALLWSQLSCATILYPNR